MDVLLTNDDGIHAEGLWALYRAFSRAHRVTVVAPDRERSGIGHGITLDSPLRISEIEVNGGYTGHAVNGTPADCIKLGILEVLENRPNAVISGINPGANTGANLNYSGTVAAAREAALCGIPAIAVSVKRGDTYHYDDVASLTVSLVREILERRLPPGTFINVNVPNMALDRMKGVRISTQGSTRFSESFEARRDPWNGAYYWHGNDPQPLCRDPDSDGVALSEDYVAITPVKCDLTDHGMVECLREWDLFPTGTDAS